MAAFGPEADMRPLSKAHFPQGWRGPKVGPSRSSCSLQLTRVQQKIARKASGLPVPVVADDDDSLHAADDGRAHSFSLLEARKPGTVTRRAGAPGSPLQRQRSNWPGSREAGPPITRYAPMVGT